MKKICWVISMPMLFSLSFTLKPNDSSRCICQKPCRQHINLECSELQTCQRAQRPINCQYTLYNESNITDSDIIFLWIWWTSERDSENENECELTNCKIKKARYNFTRNVIKHKMTDPNRMVLSYYDTLLRESDVKLLMRPRWLNDQIISFYLEYLEQCVFGVRQYSRTALHIAASCAMFEICDQPRNEHLPWPTQCYRKIIHIHADK